MKEEQFNEFLQDEDKKPIIKLLFLNICFIGLLSLLFL